MLTFFALLSVCPSCAPPSLSPPIVPSRPLFHEATSCLTPLSYLSSTLLKHTHTHTPCPLAAPFVCLSKTAEPAQARGINVCIPMKWAMIWGGRAEAVRAHQCAAPIVFGFSELCGSGRLRVWERWYEPRWALCCAREHHELRNASPDEPALQRHLWEPRLL